MTFQRSLLTLLGVAVVSLAPCDVAGADAGDLDVSFSGDGKQTTDFGGSDAAAAVAVQADGKIVVAGSSGGDFALARYGADGALDPSFSGDGLVTTDLGGTDAGQAVAIQADGRIVVAGSSGGELRARSLQRRRRARHVADDRLRRRRRRHCVGDPGRRPDRGQRELRRQLRARSLRRPGCARHVVQRRWQADHRLRWARLQQRRGDPGRRRDRRRRHPRSARRGTSARRTSRWRATARPACFRPRGRPTTATANPPTTAAKAWRSRPTAASRSSDTAPSKVSSVATSRETCSCSAMTPAARLIRRSTTTAGWPPASVMRTRSAMALCSRATAGS